MDEKETPEEAALRELKEETGYVGEQIVDVSAILAADPGCTSNNAQRDGDLLFLSLQE
jgi:ADP-ribose pyrophosphatase